MTLKEAVLQRDNLNFIELEVNMLKGSSIGCNISKNESGNYKLENPELEVEDLEGINDRKG